MKDLSFPIRFNSLKKALLYKLAPVILLLTSCGQVPLTGWEQKSGAYPNYAEGGGLYVSAAFGPDGRLWRVVPSRHYVYVDYSNDLGKTFSQPVRINSEEQKIKASGENRAGILVDKAGRIHVIYSAEAMQPSAVYYSVSSDNGLSFSEPKPISDSAGEANTYQGKLALDRNGQVHVYWHDERNRTDWRQLGNAIYGTTIGLNGLAAVSQKLSDVLCDCCRIAVAYNNQNQAVLFTRFVYEGNIRDHGIIENKGGNTSWRVTFDDWKVEACPEHGPAIAIDLDNRYHIAWFTQGKQRDGLFYAYSTDGGHHFSPAKAIGKAGHLPSHPDVLAEGKHIVLTWTEFDGTQASALVQQSNDSGESWAPPQLIATFKSETDYSFLLARKERVFVSWNSKTEGYKLLPVP